VLLDRKNFYSLDNLYSNNTGPKGKGKQNNQLKVWKFQQKGADLVEEKNIAVKIMITNPSHNCKEKSGHFKMLLEEMSLK
jgi:hypothetical protein